MKHLINLYGKDAQNLYLRKKNLQITLKSAAINFILGLSATSHDLEVTPDQ